MLIIHEGCFPLLNCQGHSVEIIGKQVSSLPPDIRIQKTFHFQKSGQGSFGLAEQKLQIDRRAVLLIFKAVSCRGSQAGLPNPEAFPFNSEIQKRGSKCGNSKTEYSWCSMQRVSFLGLECQHTVATVTAELQVLRPWPFKLLWTSPLSLVKEAMESLQFQDPPDALFIASYLLRPQCFHYFLTSKYFYGPQCQQILPSLLLEVLEPSPPRFIFVMLGVEALPLQDAQLSWLQIGVQSTRPLVPVVSGNLQPPPVYIRDLSASSSLKLLLVPQLWLKASCFLCYCYLFPRQPAEPTLPVMSKQASDHSAEPALGRNAITMGVVPKRENLQTNLRKWLTVCLVTRTGLLHACASTVIQSIFSLCLTSPVPPITGLIQKSGRSRWSSMSLRSAWSIY